MSYKAKLAEMQFAPEGPVARLIEASIRFGEALERERIAEILNLPFAAENMALAWQLARDGACSPEAAQEALRIAYLSGAPLPVGDSGEAMAQ